MSWESVTLGEVATLNPRDAKPNSETKVSFIGMSDLDATRAVTEPGHEREFGEVAKGYTQFRDGDLLAAKITPCWENGKVGEAVLRRPIGVGSTEFHVIRPSKQLDKRYALHLLRLESTRRAGELRMTGSAGQRRVPLKFLTDLQIPLPPLEEQQRIAAILDQADEIRAKRRAQLAHLDELPHALFHEMFGGTTAAHVALGEIAEVSSGITKGRRTTEPVSPTPYLAVANVQNGSLELSKLKQIDATQREIERYALRPGDIVMTEGGDPDKLGRGALWRGELDLCLHQNHVFRVRFSRHSGIEPAYFSMVLQRPETRRYFLRSAKQTTGIASINMTQLRKLPVPVPPKEAQRVFLEKIEAIQAERSRIARALEADDELFAALQHRAFRGEL